MTELIDKVARNIREHRLLSRAEKVIVGISGGVDSMVLLEILFRLSRENRWTIIVAHFNHLLRGEEADEDARFVREKAEAFNLEFVDGSQNIKKAAAQERISIEMAARQARHHFFAEAAKKENAKKVVLAHHADDQVELFWLRILRGNAGEGLGGMRWMNQSAYCKGGKRLYLVRPLLNTTKEEIIQFAQAEKIKFRDDSTNAVEKYDRNRVRLSLLPFLEKYQPALRQTTARIMEVLGAEKEWLRQRAKEWLKERKPRFSSLHVALQREVVVSQLLQAGVIPNYELVERLRNNLGAPFTIGPETILELNPAGALRRRVCKTIESSTEQIDVNLNSACSLAWGDAEFTWVEKKPGKSLMNTRPGWECFDAAKIGRAIQLRHWRAGDRFQPIGMARAVKLQDLFVNKKVPRHLRHKRIVAVAQNGEIFWVEGLRIGENFKVSSSTSRILEWRWSRRKPSALRK